MTRSSVLALVSAVAVIGLGIVAVLLGNGLLPSKADAIQKGTYAPLLIVWFMIGITGVCAAGLAAFLFNYGVRGSSGHRG
jgi:hypothetical protein